MMRRSLFWSISSAVFALLAFWTIPLGSQVHADSILQDIGVSIAGPEFGDGNPGFCNRRPGRLDIDYTYNSQRTVAYFCQRGIRLFRLPIRWERLQPRLGQPLNPFELQQICQFIGWVKAHGGSVILDIHNYGRYVMDINGQPRACIIDEVVAGQVRVPRLAFVDLWKRLSEVFADEPTVVAYALMNEPHDMGNSDWKRISQAAVNGIRALNDAKPIMVAGDGWSNAFLFAKINGPKAWIHDPLNRTIYEAHCYFDKDYSGQYTHSFAHELQQDPTLPRRPIERLQPFIQWCQTNQVPGFLGEFGVPLNDPNWRQLLKTCVDMLRQVKLGGCYWAAGEWWGNDYPLSIQPRGQIQFTDHPAIKLLQK